MFVVLLVQRFVCVPVQDVEVPQEEHVADPAAAHVPGAQIAQFVTVPEYPAGQLHWMITTPSAPEPE